jgi:hypothetical protein
MSSKNELQEYFQKRRIVLPVYKTNRVGGPDHQPVWIAQITIADGRIFMSSPNISKKAAELEAARIAFEEIETDPVLIEKPQPRWKFDFNDQKVVILIDVENQPSALSELVDTVYSTGVNFYAFYSKGHPLGRKISGSEYISDSRVTIVEVPSTRSDGADVGLMIVIGAMIEISPYTVFIIISNDHFAEAAADVIRNYNVMFPTDSKYYSKHFKAAACRDHIAACEILTVFSETGNLCS